MDELFNDPEFIALIKQYISYLKETIPTIKDQLADRDFFPVQKFGHNIKGSGGGYGYMELSTMGKNLEEAAKKEDAAACDRYLAEIDGFINNLN
ncbi:MAG: hypothetical protein ACE5D8_08155 [Fidelibacterota bacterium]